MWLPVVSQAFSHLDGQSFLQFFLGHLLPNHWPFISEPVPLSDWVKISFFEQKTSFCGEEYLSRANVSNGVDKFRTPLDFEDAGCLSQEFVFVVGDEGVGSSEWFSRKLLVTASVEMNTVDGESLITEHSIRREKAEEIAMGIEKVSNVAVSVERVDDVAPFGQEEVLGGASNSIYDLRSDLS